MSIGDKVDALVRHQLETTLDDALVELHVGNTIHEETSESVVAIVDRDRVTRLVQLIGRGETSGSGSDDGDLLASSVLRRARLHPSHLETLVDDRALDRFDSDCSKESRA